MTTIMDVVESQIQDNARIRAHADAVAFEADAVALLMRHGLGAQISTEVAAARMRAVYLDARTAQLVARGRDAVVRRLFDGFVILDGAN